MQYTLTRVRTLDTETKQKKKFGKKTESSSFSYVSNEKSDEVKNDDDGFKPENYYFDICQKWKRHERETHLRYSQPVLFLCFCLFISFLSVLFGFVFLEKIIFWYWLKCARQWEDKYLVLSGIFLCLALYLSLSFPYFSIPAKKIHKYYDHLDCGETLNIHHHKQNN